MQMADARTLHQRRLDEWRKRFPDSRHRYYDLETLEALKAANDRLAFIDMRDRPDVCRSYPSYMTIGNTHKCNLTCQMCFKQLDDYDNMSLPDMGLGRFESLAHELFPHMRFVALSVSGDPLVSKSLFTELELLATYGVRAGITTNGMPLARRGLMERLIPSTQTLIVSFDGADEPVFNSIRRGASFPRVVENIKKFNEARNAVPHDQHRPELHFNTILQFKNVRQLPQLIELAHELAVDRVYVDHVVILGKLNRGDSLEPYKRLTNEMLERAAATAERLGMNVRLPQPFTLGADHVDQPYVAFDDETLLAQGAEHLHTIPYDGSAENVPDELVAIIEDVRASGGGNEEFVRKILDSGITNRNFLWGVHQLGPSLMPPRFEKVSSCLYPWRESAIEYNGNVAPCCNEQLKGSRRMGVLREGGSFLDIWNGEEYQRLRRSLRTGRSYAYCRYCYLVESVDDAAWNACVDERRFQVEVAQGFPLEGFLPHVGRFTVTDILSAQLDERCRLRLWIDDAFYGELAPQPHEASRSWTFHDPTLRKLVFTNEQRLRLECEGVDRVALEVVGLLD